MTYLGWGVWTPDTELAHHGIPGMKWGDRNGPPYPLRPGARSGAEKKAGTPIADIFADASRKFKKKAAVSKAKRTRRKKAKYEHDRQEALRKGSAEDVLKYRGHLTNEELEKAVKRIEWENKLEALDRKSKEVGLTKADRLFGNNGALGKIKEYSGNVAAIAQNYNKIKVAMEYAMQGKTAPADKKPKETKNSDKKTSDTKAQETRSVDASSGKTSDDKPEESTQTEERRYADISSKVREYSEDRQAKDYARNQYGGIDIEKYDERRRQLRHSMTYLKHTGIKGQKWGSRRFRGYDGKLTPAGKERYYSWDRKQITNQIPDGTFAYNEVDDEVYESVGGRMVAIDHNRPDYEERKAEARRAYETQKEIEEHLKHAYLGWGIYGIVDDRTYLAHHGVKGMHWGIRRYQPYPDGKSGRFIGKRKTQRALNKLDKRLVKSNFYRSKTAAKLQKYSSKNTDGKYDKKIKKLSDKFNKQSTSISEIQGLTSKLINSAEANGLKVKATPTTRNFMTGKDVAVSILASAGLMYTIGFAGATWHNGRGTKYKVLKDQNKEPSLQDLDKNIDKRLDELERSDQRVADIKKNHTGDGYEYTMKVLNTTNDKQLSDAIKDYDNTYSKQESDRKAIAKAGGADSESTFKRMTQDPKNRSLGDRLEKASEDAEWAVERTDYSSAEERERAVRQARERQQSAYDELIKYERDTYGFSYVDYNRARGH